MKKQVISILFAIILIFILKNTCNAASATISCNSSATVGDEVTISASVTGVMWNLELKVNGETIAKNSELENYESNKTVSFSGKYTAKKEGNLTVTLEGTVTEFSDGSTIRKFGTKTITVKAPVVETPETKPESKPEPETPKAPEPESKPEPEKERPSTDTNSGTNNNSTTTTTKKSSEARLKNLGINPKEYDFSGFSKNPDKEEWSVEVPNSVTSVEVYAEPPKDSKAKVSGHGTVTLNEGNNKIGVKVTAEDGKTTKTYIINIKRKTAEEENAEKGENRLKSLGIKPEEYDFSGFDSEKTEYTAEVPNEVEQIEVVATAIDSAAQITGIGMIDLEEGENELKIEVIAVNGDKKTYTLTVTRKEAEKKEQFGLSTLSITGLKLTPSFKIGTYEYNVDLQEDLSSLEIKAKANTEDATVEIVGNENLQQGENTITILVKNEETDENATYQIIVNKNVVVVAEIVEKTSWLKPSTWGKEEKIKIAIIIVLIVLIISAVILKIKISKGNPKALKVDLPGADELDRAIAEHQELVDEENFVNEFKPAGFNGIEDINKNAEEQNYLEDIAKNRLEDFDYPTDDRPKRRGRHF